MWSLGKTWNSAYVSDQRRMANWLSTWWNVEWAAFQAAYCEPRTSTSRRNKAVEPRHCLPLFLSPPFFFVPAYSQNNRFAGRSQCRLAGSSRLGIPFGISPLSGYPRGMVSEGRGTKGWKRGSLRGISQKYLVRSFREIYGRPFLTPDLGDDEPYP